MMVHGLDYWAVPGLSQLRTQVAQTTMTHEQRQRIAQLDGYLVEAVTDLNDDEVADDLLEDDPTHPLTQLWRLGKLRAGTYPAYLLPLHLRAIYRSA